jgi:FtsP/CotA-like multicopper oxidase with cupredoxin domain
MRSIETTIKAAAVAATVLLFTAGASLANVGLTAKPKTVTLPDGRSVPMWGLVCAPGSNTNPGMGATCTALDGSAQGDAQWRPPLIRVQTHSSLTIDLTNNLPGGVPTSLMIVGQLGGDLGTPWKVDSPVHAIQGPTWPVAGEATDPVFTPPLQLKRVQSFGAEVGNGATGHLTWGDLKAGTYLIESGTHPSIQGPMGLYGVVVVSDSATEGYAQSYDPMSPVVYDMDLPLLLSEIDADQNAAVTAAVATPGFLETSVRVLRDRVSSVSLATDANGNPLPNAGGTGYHVDDVVSFTDGGGTGATARVAAVDPPGGPGAITEVEVMDGGRGYSTTPGVTTSGGTGAHLVE